MASTMYDKEGMPTDRRQHTLNIGLQLAIDVFYRRTEKAVRKYGPGKETYRSEVLERAGTLGGQLTIATTLLERGNLNGVSLMLDLWKREYPGLADGTDIYMDIKKKHGVE